ncbi:Dopey, N-terminal-domain-containing protein [Salix suchowensis]|nr:Dopey, N-terminal-domain-containing protein [Salix suchowensis]
MSSSNVVDVQVLGAEAAKSGSAWASTRKNERGQSEYYPGRRGEHLQSEGLKRDLALWSSGLFPFFEYAATSVKPTLLNLYDTHYMPLQGGLRPIMKSLILALLPGLEEETGEFFEKVLGLLDKLSGTVSHSFFFQNIWLIMLTTPSARGTSLNFLGRRLPRLNADEAALEDDNLLVRRGALDLLLQSMRVDSVAAQRACAEDRTILMRAATGVVLRRDLSLNRRLYTWLLGPDDKSDHQTEYLKKHALELLKDTLKEEMFAPSADYLESRPFKIFISLLDKWEVGAALTEVLVYDAFRAVKSLIQAGGDAGEDMTMTASTLYEAVEPQIIWKHLLTHVFGELTGDGAQTEIFSQDDEIQNIHLPIVFGAIMDVLLIELEANPSKACTPATSEALKLEEKILRQIPHVALMKRPELTASLQAETSVQRPYLFACSFYSIAPKRECGNPSRSFDNPFITAFENLTMLTEICAHDLFKDENRLQQIRECFAQLLLLVDRLVGRLSTTVTVAWVPSRWLAIILETLEQEPSSFTVVDRVASLAVALHQMKGIEPRLSLDHRATMSKMVTKLLRYLGPTYTAYHARAVSLLWALEASTTRSHVEAIIAQTMATTNPSDLQEAYDAFGVLWRLTEDHLLPGFKFKVPMMIVLDGLRNDDPNVRRIGETWMRCSLKSYQRVLDSLLYDLTNPLIRRMQTSHKLKGRELQGFYYEKTFDQRYVSHLLETLLSVVRFGGQGFVRTARVTQIKRSLHPSLLKRTESGLSVSSETPYLDALMELLLRYSQQREASHRRRVWDTRSSPTAPAKAFAANALLAQTMMDGITTVTNRHVLQHWLDFILMAIPQFQPALQAVVAPLNECICKQLLVCLADVQSAASAGGTTVDALSNSSDTEFVMLLNGMERLVLLSLAYTSEPSSSEDDDNVNEKPVTEGQARSPGYRSLHEAVRVLYAMWEAMAWTQPTTRSSKDDSLSLIFNRSRLRCRRVLEHFFRAQSAEVFESIIECWSKQSTVCDANFGPTTLLRVRPIGCSI